MDVDAARKAAGLKPLPATHQPTNPKPELVTEDPTIGNEEYIRGLPAVGRVSGTIRGTQPGDPAAALDRDARDLNEHARRIVQQRMREARKRLGRMEPPDPVR